MSVNNSRECFLFIFIELCWSLIKVFLNLHLVGYYNIYQKESVHSKNSDIMMLSIAYRVCISPHDVFRHPQKFWFVENPGKILENLGKIPENPGKNGGQHCLISKNSAQRLQRNTWRPFFGGRTKKRSSWSLWEKCRQKLHKKTFRSSLGKFGQKSFAPPKICLLLCTVGIWSIPEPVLFIIQSTVRETPQMR